ncbi:hypothetical protein [Streptomyces californicus]|uniref:hypothetical protein n=1 Tax=Streptomyces californicus TaxID=67351 RepID=UPI00379F80E6
MSDHQAVREQEYARVLGELVATADRLDAVRFLEGRAINPYVASAMHAIRYAATILWHTVPDAPPLGFRHSDEHLLFLAGNWREAALGIGEFAPERPALRLVTNTEPPS